MSRKISILIVIAIVPAVILANVLQAGAGPRTADPAAAVTGPTPFVLVDFERPTLIAAFRHNDPQDDVREQPR
jgi:predicted nicotinamide N-methyase